MTIDKIKPEKVVYVKVLEDDYHLNEGQIVKVYWNKHKQHYRTIEGEKDQHGKGYCGNWTLYEGSYALLTTEEKELL